MTAPTQIQMMTKMRAYNMQFRIGMADRFIAVNESPDRSSVTAMIECYDTKDTQYRTRVVAKGTRMVTIGTDGRRQYDETVWDVDFVPYDIAHRGTVRNEAECIEQRDWERDCHRPGNAAFPIDPFERVIEGHTTTALKKHWQLPTSV